MTELCYVIDEEGNQLSPTNYNNGHRLVRKGKAKIISKLPFVIQLLRKQDNTDNSVITCGLDVGSKFTGVALVSDCENKNKVLFKGTIEHRQDVSKLMELRKGQRRYRRTHKRYRKERYDNRASSRRKGKIPPSIKTHKDEILRVVKKISKWICIDKVIIEDVAINIKKLTNNNIYKWEYHKPNRLDENLRKATIIRDDNTCQMCGCKNTIMEVHHITPRRLKGSNSMLNLITLCRDKCHPKVTGKEMEYSEILYSKINGKNIRFDFSQRCMQGKTYLREELCKNYIIELTCGSDTANKRIDWNIEKTHSNDACVITNLQINQEDCNIKEWTLKPLRSKKKSNKDSVEGFKHRDFVSYLDSKNYLHKGYVTALYLDKKQINVQTQEKHLKRCGYKRCKLIQRPKSINFIDTKLG